MERNLKLRSPMMEGEDVLLLQERLLAAGFDPGPLDGIFGRRTRAAVLAFQEARGLEADGIAGPDTKGALLAQAPGEEGRLKADFLSYLEAQLGHIYVWGAQGQAVSAMADPEGWILERETSEKNGRRALALYYKRRGEGMDPIRAYDCSGLIMRFLQEQGLFKGDLSSRGLYGACQALAREALMPGDLLFRHNGQRIHHVGAYMGEGLVIEAMGRDVGVVKRPIAQSGEGYWNRYGRLPQLQ